MLLYSAACCMLITLLFSTHQQMLRIVFNKTLKWTCQLYTGDGDGDGDDNRFSVLHSVATVGTHCHSFKAQDIRRRRPGLAGLDTPFDVRGKERLDLCLCLNTARNAELNFWAKDIPPLGVDFIWVDNVVHPIQWHSTAVRQHGSLLGKGAEEAGEVGLQQCIVVEQLLLDGLGINRSLSLKRRGVWNVVNGHQKQCVAFTSDRLDGIHF